MDAKTRGVSAEYRDLGAETRGVGAECRDLGAETCGVSAEARDLSAETRGVAAETVAWVRKPGTWGKRVGTWVRRVFTRPSASPNKLLPVGENHGSWRILLPAMQCPDSPPKPLPSRLWFGRLGCEGARHTIPFSQHR